ncbi:MAG TPA: Gfo/Idh/MocA family oxidoreductase [Verrucomicrobiota bacterium]|jgi:predicted dehydrogenase|nr:Gfo/Idh/MocA family oxidoreductase [Verrucomicrobiota bacterium]OQC24690.1 MAG: Inositol 2-dehydrogenase [Verrucomicrobia bacterium ADurb.Bin063]HCL92200.1 hypothetical protein [Limisphaerales bacterium]HRR65192.1 Gfo/Idh/MocA family oxidoreductase [Candidatus Paceibacterota bacterium]MBP8015080.1 Gfo/Idh/MocA family oxidoreductase [Verrucomicrobiota bacterium]
MKTTAQQNQTRFTSRRGFLKTSATVAGTALIGAIDVGRFAHAAGSDTLKLGLIGCGGRGTGAAGNALTVDAGTKLWALADIFPDKIDTTINTLSPKFPDRIEVPRGRQFSGLQGYRGVIENCDVVLVVCASRFHPDYTLAAVQNKKHVFVEKPAAVDIAGVNKIMQADVLSKQNGTGVLAGVTYRYHLGRREAVQRIQAGELGEIVAVQCEYLRSPYRLIEREPGWSEMEYQLRNWYHFSWLSGDDILQSLIHDLDSALWVLGDVLPSQAYGMGGRSTHFEATMGTCFDHNQVIYEYPNGRRIYGACRTAVGCYGSNQDIFHGTKGRCNFTAFQPPYFTDLNGNRTWRANVEQSAKSPYELEHSEFLQSIRAGKPFQRAKILADSTLVSVLGQLAVYTGKKISLQEVLDSKFAFPPIGEITMNTEPPVKPGPDGLYPVAIPGQTKLL